MRLSLSIFSFGVFLRNDFMRSSKTEGVSNLMLAHWINEKMRFGESAI